MRRQKICGVKGCPFPNSATWHVPHCGHGLGGQHHHWPKRSQGGKEIVAFLCPDCHFKVDNWLWKDAVVETDGRRLYRLWDEHGKLVLERPVKPKA